MPSINTSTTKPNRWRSYVKPDSLMAILSASRTLLVSLCLLYIVFGHTLLPHTLSSLLSWLSIIIFLLQIRKGHMHCAALLNLPVFLHQLSCCTYWIRFSFALHKTKLSFTNACHLHQPSAYLPFSNLMLCIFIVIHVLSCIQATSLVFQCPSRERSSLQLNLESWRWSHWRSALSRYV